MTLTLLIVVAGVVVMRSIVLVLAVILVVKMMAIFLIGVLGRVEVTSDTVVMCSLGLAPRPIVSSDPNN